MRNEYRRRDFLSRIAPFQLAQKELHPLKTARNTAKLPARVIEWVAGSQSAAPIDGLKKFRR